MNYEKIFLKLIKTGVFLLLLTPLIIGPFGMTFSAYPKAVFFRTIVEIIFIFYLLLILLNPGYLFKFSPLILAMLVFLAAIFLSSFLGLNFYKSFFGDLERAEGIVLHIHLFIFLLILASVFHKKKEWLGLFKMTVAVSAVSSLAGILQKFAGYSFYGIDKPRISGTLTNPDFFGAYILLAIFINLFILIAEKKPKRRIIWASILILNLFTLILSKTRAAWAGMIIGLISLFFLWFFYFLKSKSNPKLRKKALLIILFFLIFIFAAVLIGNNIHFYQNDFLNRALSLLNPKTLYSRLLVWEVAFNAWKEKPFLGWGLETFGFIFDKSFRAEKHLILRDFIFDRPHSKIMDLMVSSGLLGLLSYLSIFFILFYLILKHSFSFNKKVINKNNFGAGNKEINFSPNLILIPFLTAYFTQNLFAFDTISVYLLFFLVIGFVNNNFSGNIKKEEENRENFLTKRKKIGNFIIFFFVLLSLLAVYQLNVKPTLAGLVIIKGGDLESENFSKALSNYKKGIEFQTIFDKELKVKVTERLIIVLEEKRAGKSEKETIKILSDLKPSFEKWLKKPDSRSRDFYELLARINERIYLFSGNLKALAEMEKVSRKALEFSDQRPQFYQLLGKAKILQKKYKEGEFFFQKAFNLTPKSLDDKINYYRALGTAYFKTGDKLKAAENFKKSIDVRYLKFKISPNSGKSKNEAIFMEKTALIYYYELNDFKTAKEIYQKTIKIYPEYQTMLKARLKILEKEKNE